MLEIEIAKANLHEKTQQKRKDNTFLLAVVGGLLGVLGTLINTWIQHTNEIELEKKKLNSTLIYKAIETDDREKSIENLKFLLSLKLITDDDKTLRSILENKNILVTIPALYSNSASVFITDSLKNPFADVEVFFDGIYIGNTNSLGQVSSRLSKNDLNSMEIEVMKNGVEYVYKSISRDSSGVIFLQVAPK
jgi:hypothetical protein